MEVLESFGKQFQLHPLLLEDIADTDQRSKLDDVIAGKVPVPLITNAAQLDHVM